MYACVYLDVPCVLGPYSIELLTFILSCWLAAAVCLGILLAVTAGVAYGYHYCMAEFITHTRSDVRVYVKRRQSINKPGFHSKRKTWETDDSIPFNVSDYQQGVGLPDDSLSEKWMKDQDIRKYAAKLSKYSGEQTFVEPRPQVDLPQGTAYYKFRTPPVRKVSYVPNRIISTTILQSGNSEIVLRQFDIMPNNISDLINANDTETYDYPLRYLRDDITSEEAFVDEDQMKIPLASSPLAPDIRIRVEDNPTGTLKMRHWRTTPQPVIVEPSADVDEDAVVYRAI